VISAYKTRGFINKTIPCMLAFSSLTLEAPPESLSSPQPSKQNEWDEKLGLTRKIEKCVNTLHYVLGENHGIKEKNMLRLLLPIGIEADELDNTWLAAMNSFGESRGQVAHSTAASYRATNLPDPQNEYSTVQYLLAGLRDVDGLLNRLSP
jgi:hypothetical protein